MRVSIKGRYAIAAMAYMADYYESNSCVSILNISESLGISKIFLEQIFSVLKKAGLVNSVKGSQGGYILANQSEKLRIYDILYALDAVLFEKPVQSVSPKAPLLNMAISKLILDRMDEALEDLLINITLFDVVAEIKSNDNNMFYI